MKNPAAHTRMQRGSGVLGETVGASARHLQHELRDHIPENNHADTFESLNPRASLSKQIRGNLGAVNRVPRPLSFPSDPDHLAHVAVTPVVSSLVADDEHDAGSSHGAGKITHEGASRG